MYESCLLKQLEIKKIFEPCPNDEAKYAKIIELGRALPPMDPAHLKPENIVQGCQSIMYIVSRMNNGKIEFEIQSDALIPSGLASLLLKAYSGELPETILACPPTFLDELGIVASLTPSRANGLYSLHLRMKQEALKHLVNTNKSR